MKKSMKSRSGNSRNQFPVSNSKRLLLTKSAPSPGKRASSSTRSADVNNHTLCIQETSIAPPHVGAPGALCSEGQSTPSLLPHIEPQLPHEHQRSSPPKYRESTTRAPASQNSLSSAKMFLLRKLSSFASQERSDIGVSGRGSADEEDDANDSSRGSLPPDNSSTRRIFRQLSTNSHLDTTRSSSVCTEEEGDEQLFQRSPARRLLQRLSSSPARTTVREKEEVGDSPYTLMHPPGRRLPRHLLSTSRSSVGNTLLTRADEGSLAFSPHNHNHNSSARRLLLKIPDAHICRSQSLQDTAAASSPPKSPNKATSQRLLYKIVKFSRSESGEENNKITKSELPLSSRTPRLELPAVNTQPASNSFAMNREGVHSPAHSPDKATSMRLLHKLAKFSKTDNNCNEMTSVKEEHNNSSTPPFVPSPVLSKEPTAPQDPKVEHKKNAWRNQSNERRHYSFLMSESDARAERSSWFSNADSSASSLLHRELSESNISQASSSCFGEASTEGSFSATPFGSPTPKNKRCALIRHFNPQNTMAQDISERIQIDDYVEQLEIEAEAEEKERSEHLQSPPEAAAS